MIVEIGERQFIVDIPNITNALKNNTAHYLFDHIVPLCAA